MVFKYEKTTQFIYMLSNKQIRQKYFIEQKCLHCKNGVVQEVFSLVDTRGCICKNCNGTGSIVTLKDGGNNFMNIEEEIKKYIETKRGILCEEISNKLENVLSAFSGNCWFRFGNYLHIDDNFVSMTYRIHNKHYAQDDNEPEGYADIPIELFDYTSEQLSVLEFENCKKHINIEIEDNIAKIVLLEGNIQQLRKKNDNLKELLNDIESLKDSEKK